MRRITSWGEPICTNLAKRFNRTLIQVAALCFLMARLSSAQIFTANYGNGTVGAYTTSGAVINSVLITNLDSPAGIVVSGNRLFVGSLSGGTIGEYTTAGDTVNASLISGLQTPQGLALDGEGNLYVANYASGTIGKYTTSGATVDAALISGLNGPLGISLDGKGNLYVVNANANSVGKYTTSGSTVNASLISGLALPGTVLADGNGHLYVTQRVPGQVSEYTTDGALVKASFITNVFGAVGMAIDANGHFFVATHVNTLPDNPNGKIGEYSLTGVPVNAALIPGLYWPQFIAIQPTVSAPAFQSVTLEGTMITFRWSAMTGQVYQVQYNSDLKTTNWNNFGIATAATNATMTDSDTIGLDAQRFYRIVLLP